MFEECKWIWMDGELLPWGDATIHVSSHALHYGTGVFEGIRCYETALGPALFRLDAHLERFYASGSVYGLRMPFTAAEVGEGVCEVVRQNGFRSCYVRPICYYGSKSLGLLPDKCPTHVSILAWPWASYHGSVALNAGVNITISSWAKFDSRAMPTTAKACGQYLNSILATREAVGDGYDEALLLDQSGNVCEGAGENVFIVRNGKLITNDERHSILLGVTRDAVITMALDVGLSVEIRALTVRDLISADEAFFTGTAAEVTPIRALDGRLIGRGSRGPITEVLQRRFFAAVTGCEPAYRGWLHLVPSGSKPGRGQMAEGAD
jgi:branched-chain amino acid aminotransferase